MTDEELLAEIEDLIRNIPNPQFSSDTDVIWAGQAKAVLNSWDSIRSALFRSNIDSAVNLSLGPRQTGLRKTAVALNEVRYELRMKTLGPVNVAVGTGMVFDYFDTLRKTIELAASDILFIDPYLEAEFASKY